MQRNGKISIVLFAIAISTLSALAQDIGPSNTGGTPGGAAGGALAGTYPNPTMANVAAVSHQWMDSIAGNVFHLSQPTCVDLSNAGTGCSAGAGTNAAQGIVQGDGVRLSCTTGTCTTVLGATFQSANTGLNPAGTTSSTITMAGMGSTCKITPVVTGRILISFSGQIIVNGAQNMKYAGVTHGTGAIPGSNAAVTGTLDTVVKSFDEGITSDNTPFTDMAIVTGLSLSTQVWVDLRQASTNNAATANYANVNCTIYEF